MILFIVDSDWLVDYLKGKTDALELLTPLIESASLATSVIVYGEVYEGMLQAGIAGQYVQSLDDAVTGVPILELDIQCAKSYASARATLRSRGQLVPDNDLWLRPPRLPTTLPLSAETNTSLVFRA